MIMTSIFLLLSSISLLSWIYLFFIHGRKNLIKDPFFWSNKINFDTLIQENKKNKDKGKKGNNLSIIIPARNEEQTIGLVITSIIRQTYKNFNLIIVNDHSSDNTVEEILKVTSKYNFKHFQIIDSKPLPRGWTGKTWALNQGIIEGLKQIENKYFMFLDADIVIKENIVENLIKHIVIKDLQMVSIMAKLNCSTFWEKLLIPPFIYFFQKLFPFYLVNSKKSSLSAAAGGCICCKSIIFKDHDIMNKIRNYIIDDCNLAKQIKNIGPIWLGLSSQVTSVRVYSNLRQIWNMISRCAFEQLKNSLSHLLISSIVMFTIYLACPLIFMYCLFTLKYFEAHFFLLFLLPILLMTVSYYPTIRFYKLNFFYTLTIPLSAIFYLLMTLNSAYNYYFRDGNNWKNRKYKNS